MTVARRRRQATANVVGIESKKVQFEGIGQERLCALFRLQEAVRDMTHTLHCCLGELRTRADDGEAIEEGRYRIGSDYAGIVDTQP
jgi:hypothetical protein